MDAPPTPTELANALDISVPYASQLLSGERGGKNMTIALRVHARYPGLKIGPLAGVDDADIPALHRAHGVADHAQGEAA